MFFRKLIFCFQIHYPLPIMPIHIDDDTKYGLRLFSGKTTENVLV